MNFVWNLLTLRSVLNEVDTFGEDMSDNKKTCIKTDDANILVIYSEVLQLNWISGRPGTSISFKPYHEENFHASFSPVVKNLTFKYVTV